MPWNTAGAGRDGGMAKCAGTGHGSKPQSVDSARRAIAGSSEVERSEFAGAGIAASVLCLCVSVLAGNALLGPVRTKHAPDTRASKAG